MIKIERRSKEFGGNVYSYKDNHYSSLAQALIKWTYTENYIEEVDYGHRYINYKDVIDNLSKVPLNGLDAVSRDSLAYVCRLWNIKLVE